MMRVWTGLSMAVLLFWSSQIVALDAAKEYEIKAAFLYNLGSFIKWPTDYFGTGTGDFVLCVLGEDPFGEVLEVITAGQTISGHRITIRRFNHVEQAVGCHVVFISTSKQLRISAVLNWLAGKPIATVSDMPNFIVSGGMVMFFPHRNRIRLALTPEAFFDAGLKPTAHLMRVAKKVGD